MSPSAQPDPSRSGGINPFSGPEVAPGPARADAAPATRRPVPTPPLGRSAAPLGATPSRRAGGSACDGQRGATRRDVRLPRSGAPRRDAPTRAAAPTHAAPSRAAGPGAPTDLLPRIGSPLPPGHALGGPGGPHGWGGGPRRRGGWGGWGGWPTRRAASGLFVPNQRITEPPAGLGGGRYPAPILPPLAGAGRAGYPWSRGAWQGHTRPPWIVAGVVLVVVAVLGVTGAVLLAQRIGARDQSLLVQARELSYRVPADWRMSPGSPETSAGGVALDGVATGGRYVCGGRGRYRATVGSTFLVRRDGVDARPEDAARDFGPMFASSFYGAGATATASAPVPSTVGALTGSTSVVTAHPAPEAGCPGLTGRLTVLAVPTTRRGAAGGTGVLLLVVQHDADGGPSSPPPVDGSVVSGILNSVRVTDVPADAPPVPVDPAGVPADTTGGGASPGH